MWKLKFIQCYDIVKMNIGFIMLDVYSINQLMNNENPIKIIIIYLYNINGSYYTMHHVKVQDWVLV